MKIAWSIFARALFAAGLAMMAAQARAQDEDFSRSGLQVFDKASIFNAPPPDVAIGRPLNLRLRSRRSVKDLVRRGIEIRIYSLQPNGGDWKTSQPAEWETLEDCLVYLSLTFRFSQRELNRFAAKEEINLGVLNASAGWLAQWDRATPGTGHYLLVVEPVTTPDAPTFRDWGGLAATYELVRLTKATKDSYFGRGHYFRVSTPPFQGDGAPDATLNNRIRQLAAAAKRISVSFHCYAAQAGQIAEAPQPAQIALAETCETGTGIERRTVDFDPWGEG